jgi:DNA-binding NarL/FixJ family response regulator
MPQLKPVRILVVDDYEPWRQWVSSLLSKQEHLQLVAEVSDGLEAVQKIQLLRPDLILLDLALPNLNGIEVARAISESAHSVKIMFVSNEIDAAVVNAALSNGALGYVAKADAGAELLPAIESALRGETFLSRRIKGLKLEDCGEGDCDDCDDCCVVGSHSSKPA